MIKMMILAPRRPDMSHAQFRDYVVKVHGPLVKSVPEVAAGIRRYHYNFPLTDQAEPVFGHPAAARFDIETEAWFDSRNAQLRNMSEPRYLEIVRPDEGRFADEANAVFHYTHEITVQAGEPTVNKLFLFRRRKPGLSREAFQSLWRCHFTEIIADSAVWRSAVAGCVQNHVLPAALQPLGDDPRLFDLIDEVFLSDPTAWTRLKEDKGLLHDLAALEAELTAPGGAETRATETVRNIA